MSAFYVLRMLFIDVNLCSAPRFDVHVTGEVIKRSCFHFTITSQVVRPALAVARIFPMVPAHCVIVEQVTRHATPQFRVTLIYVGYRNAGGFLVHTHIFCDLSDADDIPPVLLTQIIQLFIALKTRFCCTRHPSGRRRSIPRIGDRFL